MTMLPGNATLPIIGWIDEPASEGIVGPAVRVTGWALAASRIRTVELRMDRVVLTARFGLPQAVSSKGTQRDLRKVDGSATLLRFGLR